MNFTEVVKMYSEHNTLNFGGLKVKEKNYFDIGTRGHYENPFTEILAYLLNSSDKEIENSNFRNSFFKNFLKGNEEIVESFSKSLSVTVQAQTINGNFIDMILFNEEYVVAIENKIDHILINPLEDYEKEIESRFLKQKKKYFVFSKNEISDKGKWVNIKISEVFKNTKNGLLLSNNNKWDFFILEFINHYIEKETSMTKDEIEFFTANYPKIIKSYEMFDRYIEFIKKKVDDSQSNRINVDKRWGSNGSVGIRFYPQNENNNSAVFILRIDGKFSVAVYFQPKYGIEKNTIKKIIGDKYKNWHEGQWFCFELYETYYCTSLDESIEEIKKQIENMIKIDLLK